jgi:GxxExxY protein
MTDHELLERDTTNEVIGAFFDVYNKLGYGFLEHVYNLALERELVARGRSVAREVSVQIFYDGVPLTTQRVDMIVDGTVLVESKSSATLPPTAQRQTLNYLRATSLQVALLLHFGPEPRFHRLVHTRKAFGKSDPPDAIGPGGKNVGVAPS